MGSEPRFPYGRLYLIWFHHDFVSLREWPCFGHDYEASETNILFAAFLALYKLGPLDLQVKMVKFCLSHGALCMMHELAVAF